MAIQHGPKLRLARTQEVGRLPTADECARMQRDGYLVVRGLLGAERVAEVSRWTAELAEAPESSGRHWVYREDSLTTPGQRLIQRIENFCPYHERLDELARDGGLAHWTGALMGAPMVLFKDKINFKMPGAGGFKAHQDQQAGWSRYAPLFVTAMLTLDAATLENGCLEIATGRRRTGLIGEQWTPLAEDDPKLQAIPTAPGDAIFFDSFVPHASKPNLTQSPRRVLYLTYNFARDGDHRAQYFADKYAAFPPDVDREPDKVYVFRV